VVIMDSLSVDVTIELEAMLNEVLTIEGMKGPGVLALVGLVVVELLKAEDEV
jgi:hypothetical protein